MKTPAELGTHRYPDTHDADHYDTRSQTTVRTNSTSHPPLRTKSDDGYYYLRKVNLLRPDWKDGSLRLQHVVSGTGTVAKPHGRAVGRDRCRFQLSARGSLWQRPSRVVSTPPHFPSRCGGPVNKHQPLPHHATAAYGLIQQYTGLFL